jgi:hypothetical protein
MMINWISFDEWRRYYDSYYSTYYRSNRIDFFEKEIMVDISLDELRIIIPVEPVTDPSEMDEPGPCERWYCCINELLFFVTYYHTASGKYTLITCIAPLFEGKYRWSFLEKSIDLPSPIMNRIAWIHGHDRAEQSIWIADADGSKYEFYRAKTYLEATELIDFLPSFKTRYTCYIGAAESRNLKSKQSIDNL